MKEKTINLLYDLLQQFFISLRQFLQRISDTGKVTLPLQPHIPPGIVRSIPRDYIFKLSVHQLNSSSSPLNVNNRGCQHIPYSIVSRSMKFSI